MLFSGSLLQKANWIVLDILQLQQIWGHLYTILCFLPRITPVLVKCLDIFVCVWSLVIPKSILRMWGSEYSVIPEARPILPGKDYDCTSLQAFFPTGSFWDFTGKVVLYGSLRMASFLWNSHLALSGAKLVFWFISLLPQRKDFRGEPSCRWNCKGVPFLNYALSSQDFLCFGCGYKSFPQSHQEILHSCSGMWGRQLFLLLSPFARC